MVKKLLLLILIPLLNACSSTDTTMIGEKRKPINIELVKIYEVAPEKYDAIATMSSSSASSLTYSEQNRKSQAIDKLKRSASELGANGILLTSIEEKTSPTPVQQSSGAYLYMHGSKKVVKAVAIYVPE